jgi:hypothetical protein
MAGVVARHCLAAVADPKTLGSGHWTGFRFVDFTGAMV